MPDFIDTENLSIHQSISDAEAKPSFVAVTREQVAIIKAIPPWFRKWDGKAVVEMSDAEKQAVVAAEKQAAEDRRVSEFDAASAVTAASLVLFDEINALRTRAGLQARTVQQFKDAVRAKLKTIGGA